MFNSGQQKLFNRRIAMLFLVIGIVFLGLKNKDDQTEKNSPVWSFAATGDSIITRKISVYDDPLFIKWVKITREADVAFTNLECQIFRFREFRGFPAAQHGGGYERGEPEVAEDLKWAGFDLALRMVCTNGRTQA